MSVLVMILWVFCLGFLAVMWLGVAASLFEMSWGLVGRPPLPGGSSTKDADRPARVWRRGVVAGAVGYAIVVVLYAALHAIRGHSMFLTPALLGQSLLGKPLAADGLAATVLLYNGLHLVVFLALGLGAAWLLLETERHPKMWYPIVVLVLAVFFHAIGVVLWLAAPTRSVIPAWSVVLTTAAAGLAMAVYLLRSRPQTRAILRIADLETRG